MTWWDKYIYGRGLNRAGQLVFRDRVGSSCRFWSWIMSVSCLVGCHESSYISVLYGNPEAIGNHNILKYN